MPANSDSPGLTPGTLRPGLTLRMAVRNLARNRRRTWITVVTIAVSVFLLHITSSLLVGLENQSFDNLIFYQTGHAEVYPAGYFEEREELPLDNPLDRPEALLEDVRGVEGVAAAAPRIVFQAQLSNGIDQIPVQGIGMAVAEEGTEALRLDQAVVKGAYLSPGSEGLLLGSGLAEFFEASIGDWLTVLTKTKQGAYEALDLPVLGLLGTGNPQIDRNSFLISLETARSMLQMEGEATEIVVRFAPAVREEPTARRLEAALAGRPVEVKRWEEIEADFMALVETKRLGSLLMLGLFVLIAVVGIANTILMAAFERIREIGTLMAMGLRPSGIRKLFLTEGALLGGLGGLTGTIPALAPIIYFSVNGMDLLSLYGDVDVGYPVKGLVYMAVSPAFLIGVVLATVALAGAASYYPAARANRENPAEALRHV